MPDAVEYRKVRCTITLSGPPCANCAVDNIPCEIKSRKRRRNTDILPAMSDSGMHDTSMSSSQNPSAAQLSNSQSESPHWDTSRPTGESSPSRWGSMTDGPSDLSPDHSQQAHNASSATSNRDTIIVDQSIDEGEISVAVDAEVDETIQSERRDEVETPPIANATSAWAETLEEHESDGNRVPFYPESLQPEEIEFLRWRGCFTLPPQLLQDALIKAYFHHCHSFEPVLDPQEFFDAYSKGQLSLLLLWSVFMCAATFVEDSLFLMNPFQSPLTFKRNAFQRAKTLYDVDYEKNKVTLIQSVFLMGHFYADAEDRLGPWHWNGIAISLSHTIGLHMMTSPSRNGIKPLWRRIWWCIHYREVWLSMGQGRPMRISLDHCSTPMPGLYDTSPSYSPEYQHFVPENLGARPSKAIIERDENEIRAHWIHDENNDQSAVLASHTYQYRLHTQAAIIALYRPFLHETPDGVPDDEQDSWKALAKSKLRTAAAHATHAINCMMAEDLIKFAQTIAVLTISPPIQVHLIEMASSKSSSGKLAKYNLALCLLALDEMRKYYVSADAAYKLFDRARIMVEKSLRNDEIVSRGSAPAADCPREPQGVETSEWLDESASMGYEVTSQLETSIHPKKPIYDRDKINTMPSFLNSAFLAALAGGLLASANTSNFQGVNSTVLGDSFVTGPLVLRGLNVSDDYDTVRAKADAIFTGRP
ncbi:Cutinase transcription factor 1 beta [Fusarium agapanthi]|uniref:Cutinase transcription factor 1 beta n=1 Tax=Fusarium agapanthi TaxID=1803897 RepID=A0A9P5EHA3_9HYPO|nr:Cutinase transcription factor 1 beta [Fusarium agapanthi]